MGLTEALQLLLDGVQFVVIVMMIEGSQISHGFSYHQIKPVTQETCSVSAKRWDSSTLLS